MQLYGVFSEILKCGQKIELQFSLVISIEATIRSVHGNTGCPKKKRSASLEF